MTFLLSGGTYILWIVLPVLGAMLFVGWLVAQTLRALELLAKERNERRRLAAAHQEDERRDTPRPPLGTGLAK